MNVFGIPIFSGSKQSFLISVGDRLAAGATTHVVTLNSEMVVKASRDALFREVLERADIIAPDGVGIAIAARILRRRRIARLPGIELAEGILKLAERSGRPVFLLGAKEHILEAASSKLLEAYPRLRVAGKRHGYFQGKEEEVVSEIITSGAEILLVGTGSPGQECFIFRTRSRLPCKLMVGIGGSYDVWAGLRRRASVFLQRLGMEWLHRTLVDYKRWPRLAFIPSFVWMVLKEKVAGRNEA